MLRVQAHVIDGGAEVMVPVLHCPKASNTMRSSAEVMYCRTAGAPDCPMFRGVKPNVTLCAQQTQGPYTMQQLGKPGQPVNIQDTDGTKSEGVLAEDPSNPSDLLVKPVALGVGSDNIGLDISQSPSA